MILRRTWHLRIMKIRPQRRPQLSLGGFYILYTKAIRLAATSQHGQQGMAAIAIRGGAVINAAVNFARPQHHAEFRAMRNQDRADYVIVARHNGGISRPCINCYAFLRKMNVCRVVYCNVSGILVSERL